MKPRDFDQLSAYLDDQLSPREKAALEARLAHDAELQAALGDLRLTVNALRSLPRLKAPRSFVLTPALVGGASPARRPFFPALRLAAALSAVALVVVMAGDIAMTTGMLPGAPGAEPQAVSMMAPEAPEADMEAQAQMAPDEPPPAEATRAAAAAEVEAFEATAQGAVGAGVAAPEAETPAAAELTVLPTPAPGSERKTGPEATEAVAEAPAGMPDQADAHDAQTTIATAPPTLPTLRIVQAALAMLTVLLGLAAWFTRRGG